MYRANARTCREKTPYRGSSTPRSSCPAAASSPPGRGGRPGPACIGQNGQPKWRPEFFFFLFDTRLKFLDDAGLKIPHGYECPLRRLWLRPTYEEIPAELTFRALSRPKWRGCGLQANLRGFSPPTTPAPWRGVAYGAGLHACSASIYWLLTKFLLCMR